MEEKYFNRELSWLSFNYRVLQEAKDPKNPLYARINFLAIYSSNLDEFFRVRVASLRSLLPLKDKSLDKLKFNPVSLLNKIKKTVNKQQEEFGKIYREQILPELEQHNIHLASAGELTEVQKNWLQDFFLDDVKMHIQPILLAKKKILPFLKNQRLYFAVKLHDTSGEYKQEFDYALVEIPSNHLPRFIELPVDDNGVHNIIFLDDVVKLFLADIFPGYEIVGAYSIKITRDAELYIDDEFSGNLLTKIKKGLKKRDTGAPSRLLYDANLPDDFLTLLKEVLFLHEDGLVPGGSYHNYSDFFSFPNPVGEELENKPLPPIPHSAFEETDNIFKLIKEKNRSLYYPYHKYNYVIDFLKKAADDPDVTSIMVTQYRVAKDSEVVKALITAAKNGKDVMAFVEVKARFDEELNIQWAGEMEKAGVKVYYSFPGLKVHAKLALVNRSEEGKNVRYGYMATGNFNEKTAKLYTDLGYFTADKSITSEINQVFRFLARKEIHHSFDKLLVAKFNMRDRFSELIQNEIDNAAGGKEASIIIKMNSLEDKKMIKKLYEASQSGVKIKLIIRGICCLVPGVEGMSENIQVISILDRFLEHSRFYIFHNDGNQVIYAASADWMKRNLSRRIEVGFPVTDDYTKKMINDIIEFQLNDNTKARIINSENSNEYVLSGEEKVSSQSDLYQHFQKYYT